LEQAYDSELDLTRGKNSFALEEESLVEQEDRKES
jgi:hypothetical protein